jgi:hypothetical protein
MEYSSIEMVGILVKYHEVPGSNIGQGTEISVVLFTPCRRIPG